VSLLSPKLRQHLRNQNTTTSKHLRTAGLELLAEPRQKLIDALKLQVRAHRPTTRAGTTNRSAKRVKLMPDSSTLGVELIISRLTLLKSMLLINHRHIKSISGWLIALTKMSPYVSNSRRTHKLRGKL
jgi:hypothetical protein